MQRIASLAAFGLFLSACATAPECAAPQTPDAAEAAPAAKAATAPESVTSITIPPLDEWTDRYADGKKGDVRFFNLTKVMARYGLSRLQALEVQNHYRDLTRADAKLALGDALDQAVAKAKAGDLECGVDAKAMAAAKFIVVFDLDDTLYDQYYDGAKCNTVAFERANGKMKHIHMVPGWEDAVRRINALGGKVVIFSANLDDRTITNLRHIQLDGKDLMSSPLIAGVFTNSHLIQQEKTEPPGSAEKPRKGRPVLEPSKDLRPLDESLERIIIVDDNPLRLFQFRNVRVFKKFHADHYCGDPEFKKTFDGVMGALVKEIEDSVAHMDANPGTSFVTAYLPFSQLGRIAVRFVMEGRGLTLVQAVEYVRKHPGVVDKRL